MRWGLSEVMIAVLLFFTFLFYRSTLFNYFVSDDFTGFPLIRSFYDIIKMSPYNNHYSPLVTLIVAFLNRGFAFNPFPYHVFSLIIHLVNIYLVYLLSKKFFSDSIKSGISALLFAFFFANYEVVYWYGAWNNSFLVTTYVASLLFLIQYIETKKIRYSLLFQIGFICALLTHEYAISLVVVGAVYWWLFSKKRKKMELASLFCIPIFSVVATTVLKAIIVQIPLLVRTPSILKYIAFTMRSFVYLFIPNPYIVDRIPNFGIPLIFLLILILFYYFVKNKRTVFLLIWLTATIGMYVLTSAPQARYFYLSAVPAIFLIVSILSLKKTYSIVYLLFIFISGLIFLQNQKIFWKQSSEIVINVIQTIKKEYPKSQKNETVYFVNLPDSSNDSVWKAYVFRAGFGDLLTKFARVSPKKIVHVRSFIPTSHTIEAPYMSPKKLSELAKSYTIFVYKEELKDVVLLKPSP